MTIEVFSGTLDGGRIARVKTGHGVEQHAAVFGGSGHRSALIEGRRKGNHAKARYSSIGRFDAGHATQGCRLTDRATGVGAGGSRC